MPQSPAPCPACPRHTEAGTLTTLGVKHALWSPEFSSPPAPHPGGTPSSDPERIGLDVSRLRACPGSVRVQAPCMGPPQPAAETRPLTGEDPVELPR